MAQATVELGRLITRTNFKLFDFSYQFDDPTYKAYLEQNVIDFFYDYEIGFETPDMFKRKFKARWNRIITYYNKLYNTTLLSYNPLTNYSMSEALEQLSKSSNDSSTTTNNQSTSNSDSQSSDYPQQPIAGGDFLAGASKITSNNTSNDNASSSGKGETSTNYSKTIEGITGGSYPELIQKHRDALMRINDMIINEMKPCFILVF